MHKCSATLLGSPCQCRAHYLHDDLCASYCAAGEICIAETWIDRIDDDEGRSCSGSGGNGADGEELEEFTDLVAALMQDLVTSAPSRRSKRN